MPKSEEPTAPFPLQNKTTVAASTILAVTQQQEQPSDKSETRLNQPQYTSSTTQGTGFSHAPNGYSAGSFNLVEDPIKAHTLWENLEFLNILWHLLEPRTAK